LDSLNPNYNIPTPEFIPSFKFDPIIESYGLYVQNQVALNDQLRLLIGGRYDWVTNDTEIANFGSFGNAIDDPVQSDGAFSPRIGLVYQPGDIVSLYASYSRSFRQSIGVNPDGRVFEPTRGTQYEVGIKTNWLDNRLSATLAAYYLTRTNVVTPDPDNPVFSVQTGEQRSQGIELDVQGEILPGWNLIASYAFTDAEVIADNSTPVGNRLANVPRNQASLWTTYTIQKGALRGLGFGLGLFYVGERQVDLANSFELDDYLRTDLALYYRRGRFRGAINVRNLFDIDYAGYGISRNSAQRGDPFTITSSVSWEF
jgi:iron complex outermembrane recepter protein